MRKESGLKLFIVSCAVLLLIVLYKPVQAEVRLLEGDLIISGFLKDTAYINTQRWDRSKKYKGAVDYWNTSFYIDGLYTFTEDPFGTTFKFFTGIRWWWEKSLQLYPKQKRTVLARNRDDYQKPQDWQDYITEMYFDYMRGPLQVRVGKQIVIWGQNDVGRVADVVNPLDIRWGFPGVDTWEEVKKGLWMLRAFYTTNLPGNLMFEIIYNPGDFKAMELSYTGTHWGPEYFRDAQFSPGKEMGMFTWLREKMRKDRPGFDTRNTEFGGRIRGYTLGVDWTLLYWNARDDGPVAHPGRVNDLALQYVFAGIEGAMSGGRVNPGRWPSQQIFHYKRYQTVGGTAQWLLPWFRYSSWDVEWFLEIKRPLNLGEGGSSSKVYGWTRKNIFGFSIKYTDRFKLPRGFRDFIKSDKDLDLTITYFYENIFDHRRDLVVADRNHRPGDSATDGVSVWAKLEILKSSVAIVPLGNYYFRTGSTMIILPIQYYFPEPYGNWRAMVGYKMYLRKRHKTLSSDFDRKDAVMLRLSYEF